MEQMYEIERLTKIHEEEKILNKNQKKRMEDREILI